MMNRFEGKVVIVTGAGTGIGAATTGDLVLTKDAPYQLMPRSQRIGQLHTIRTGETSFSDTVHFLAAPAGDVVTITATGSEVEAGSGGGALTGSSSTGAETFHLEPFYIHSCYNATACVVTATLPVDQLRSVTLYGDVSYLIGPNVSGEMLSGGFDESFTVQLFKADGVTPDTFTPEPSSVGLTVFGGFLAAGLLAYRGMVHL